MFILTNISVIIFLATMVNIFTAYVAWQRRKSKGGIYFATAMMVIVLWSLFSGLDYAAVPLSLKVFFAKLEYTTYLPALSLMTVYSIIYAGHEDWLKKISVQIFLLLVPLSGILLAWTNEYHKLLWTDLIPSSRANNAVDFIHGPGFLWVSLSGYFLVLLIALNLLQVATTSMDLPRKQARLMLLALAVPIASNLLYIFDRFNAPGVDWSSITFSITGVIFLIALYGSRFMEIVPTARNMMLDQMSDGVLVVDEHMRLVDFNPSARSISGIDQKDLWNPIYDTPLKEFPEIIALFEDPLKKTARDFHFNQKSYNIQRIPLSDQRQQVYGHLVMIHDITERKEFEYLLNRRNETLAALNQATFDLVNRFELDDILQTFLVKASSLLDAPDISVDLLEDENTIVTYAATSDQPLAKGDILRRGEGGWLSWQAVDSGQYIVLDDYATWPQRRREFDEHPFHAILIIPVIQLGRVIGAINCSRTRQNHPFNEIDIDIGEQLAQIVALMLNNSQIYHQLRNELAERRQIQEVLRISQENFSGYFNMGAVGMSVTAPDKSWIEVNDQLCRMLGYSREELKQLTWSSLSHPDDLEAELELFHQALRGERNTYQLDTRFIRQGGGILHVSLFVSCQRFPNGSPRYFLASLVDISQRVEQQAALLATQEQLVKQHRALAVIEERQRLARDLHDSVSQSLHSLNLFSETLISSLEKGNKERAHQLAERLQESARQALKETRLMLYQLQPAEMEMQIDLMREIEIRLTSVEERSGLRTSLIMEGDANECPVVWRENLFRITIEALNNSLKHAQAHNVTVSLRCDKARAEVQIADDGIGFNLNRMHSGGMGLRNMHERAELLGGTLEIRSTPNEGTRVTVCVEKREVP
jgi:PAS domain S-box-containing protein